MNSARALSFITSQPWLITEDALELIAAIAQRDVDPSFLAAKRSGQVRATQSAEQRDGAAIIPITGPIFRYANFFAEISGATTTETIAKDFQTAMDDPSVRSIIFDINSPGGAASGINELADLVYSARGDKPIIAYVGGQGASAAYWIASAADEIVIDKTAMVGSIGALVSLTDTSQRDAKAGIRSIQIVSSQSPHKVNDPTQDAGKAKLQAIVDELAGVFIDTVARNRGVDSQTVQDEYGAGGQMVGQSAINAGMADRLGSLESVIAELNAPTSPKRTFFMSTPNRSAGLLPTARGPISITTTSDLRLAFLNGHTVEEITVLEPNLDEIRAAAKAEGVTESEAGKAAAIEAAVKTAVEGERTRVVELNAIGMKGFEKDIEAAIKSGATVEATAVNLTKLAKSRGTTLDAQAQDASRAIGHGGAQREPSASAGSGWGAVTARFKNGKRGR